MVDRNALVRVAEAANLTAEDVVLEVGAGLGHLTHELAERAGRVVAVEVDERLVPLLRMEMAGHKNVELVTGDVLEFAPGVLLGGVPYKVVANVPYHITSALMRHFLEAEYSPVMMVVTVQREVAERLAAGPGEMSLLAVSVQFYGSVEVVTRITPAAFFPRPEVESAIVRIVPHDDPTLPPERREGFFRVVRAGFGQKRKQLKNSLSAGLRISSEEAVAGLEAAGVDPKRRAQTLSLAEWGAVYEVFRRRDVVTGLGDAS